MTHGLCKALVFQRMDQIESPQNTYSRNLYVGDLFLRSILSDKWNENSATASQRSMAQRQKFQIDLNHL